MILVGKIVYKNYLILSCLMDKKYNKLMLGGKSGKNLKGKSKNIYYLVYSIVFLLYACHSNQIRFAPETNTIYTVDNYPIRKLNVVMENAKLNFSITRVDTLEGLPYIKLDSIGDNYEIVEETNKLLYRLIPQKKYCNIPFVPSEVYGIYHSSNGDASTCIIYILTDENGKVNKVMTEYEYNNYQQSQN